MSKQLREAFVSNSEKKFVVKCLEDSKRIDGRSFDEFRRLVIEFGKDWGCCNVSLGDTRVLAQVSCEVQVPKSTRPSEGILYINIELNPLGAPHFEAGRQSDLSVQLNRLLEKCIKDSKAVDLESLCIKVNEKVWALRVDINVLNHEGNILDCASIAALAALAHFRRPDVTCDGEEIVIHTYAQRDSIPTVIHHYPVCISYAIFSNGDIILADPTLLEEGVSEAHLMIGLNAYKELCGLHLGGNALMSPALILKTTSQGAQRANVVITEIKDAIEKDTVKRKARENVGFQYSTNFENNAQEDLTQCLDQWSFQSRRMKKKLAAAQNMEVDDKKGPDVLGEIHCIGTNSAALIPTESADGNQWTASSEEEEEEVNDASQKMDDDENEPKNNIVDSDGSEEENVIVLNADNKTNKKKRKNKIIKGK